MLAFLLQAHSARPSFGGRMLTRSSVRRFLPLSTILLLALGSAGCNGSSSAASKDLSGTYTAAGAGGTMTLQFNEGHKVRVIHQDKGGKPEGVDADYMIDGDKVTVQAAGGFPFELHRNGDLLEGSPMNMEIMHFKKQ
jgi:hypothetical protein